MATLISHSPDETLAIGAAWGREAQPGWIIGLNGDLGAGKTQLVKGIAQGLGTTGRVHSPTFTLVNQYEGGRHRLFHLDLYRLETAAQITGAGLEPYLDDPDGVAVVEWAARWPWQGRQRHPDGHGSSSFLRLAQIEILDEHRRRITYEDSRA